MAGDEVEDADVEGLASLSRLEDILISIVDSKMTENAVRALLRGASRATLTSVCVSLPFGSDRRHMHEEIQLIQEETGKLLEIEGREYLDSEYYESDLETISSDASVEGEELEEEEAGPYNCCTHC